MDSLLKVDTDSTCNLCYQFLDCFANKIMKIRTAIDSSDTDLSDSESLAQREVEHPMTDLAATSEDEVQKIVQAAKSHQAWTQNLHHY